MFSLLQASFQGFLQCSIFCYLEVAVGVLCFKGVFECDYAITGRGR
jgi:hypothetical protein